jgi:hypothetical protein
MRYSLLLVLVAFGLAACGTEPTATPGLAGTQAVTEQVAAAPKTAQVPAATNTPASAPTSTKTPTPTPANPYRFEIRSRGTSRTTGDPTCRVATRSVRGFSEFVLNLDKGGGSPSYGYSTRAVIQGSPTSGELLIGLILDDYECVDISWSDTKGSKDICRDTPDLHDLVRSAERFCFGE